MKKILCLFLVLIFITGCSQATNYGLPPGQESSIIDKLENYGFEVLFRFDVRERRCEIERRYRCVNAFVVGSFFNKYGDCFDFYWGQSSSKSQIIARECPVVSLEWFNTPYTIIPSLHLNNDEKGIRLEMHSSNYQIIFSFGISADDFTLVYSNIHDRDIFLTEEDSYNKLLILWDAENIVALCLVEDIDYFSDIEQEILFKLKEKMQEFLSDIGLNELMLRNLLYDFFINEGILTIEDFLRSH